MPALRACSRMSSSCCLALAEGFLFVGNVLLVLGVLLVPIGFVLRMRLPAGEHDGGGANLIFTLQHVELAGQQVDLIFLRRNLVAPLFPGSLLVRLIFVGCLGLLF